MTPEQTFAISVLAAVLTSVVAPAIVSYLNRHKTQSETDLNFSQTIKQYIEGGGDIAEMALKIASEYERQSVKLNAKIDELMELVSLQNDYIKTLADVLRASGIDIPPRPDKLRESQKFKAIKP